MISYLDEYTITTQEKINVNDSETATNQIYENDIKNAVQILKLILEQYSSENLEMRNLDLCYENFRRLFHLISSNINSYVKLLIDQGLLHVCSTILSSPSDPRIVLYAILFSFFILLQNSSKILFFISKGIIKLMLDILASNNEDFKIRKIDSFLINSFIINFPEESIPVFLQNDGISICLSLIHKDPIQYGYLIQMFFNPDLSLNNDILIPLIDDLVIFFQTLETHPNGPKAQLNNICIASDSFFNACTLKLQSPFIETLISKRLQDYLVQILDNLINLDFSYEKNEDFEYIEKLRWRAIKRVLNSYEQFLTRVNSLSIPFPFQNIIYLINNSPQKVVNMSFSLLMIYMRQIRSAAIIDFKNSKTFPLLKSFYNSINYSNKTSIKATFIYAATASDDELFVSFMRHGILPIILDDPSSVIDEVEHKSFILFFQSLQTLYPFTWKDALSDYEESIQDLIEMSQEIDSQYSIFYENLIRNLTIKDDIPDEPEPWNQYEYDDDEKWK